jgi:arginase family enzyme
LARASHTPSIANFVPAYAHSRTWHTRCATELPLAGADVVEVSPPYDGADVTAPLANRVVLEVLGGLAWRRDRAPGPLPW